MNRVIVRRRIKENKLAELKTAVAKNYHLGSIAVWEESSSKLMLNKFEERKKLELDKRKQFDLEIRKTKLHRLLIEDDIKHKKEIDSQNETPQQRRDRLEKRAKELRVKRIKRRKQFVAQQRLKQFREQCDELRLNNGRNLTMSCHRVRNQQIEENKLKKQYEQTVDNKHFEIWKNELQKKIDRENQESEYKKELNYDTAKQLKKQIEENEYEFKKAKLNKENQIKQRVELLKKDDELTKINKLKLFEEKERKRNEIEIEYEEYQIQKQLKEQHEKQLDKQFIKNALVAEEKESLQKQEKNKGNKEDITNYLLYLNELKKREKENEKLFEELRQKELEKEWHKREIKWKREELARKQLLQNVFHERQNQIAYNQFVKQKNSQNGAFETQKILKELKEFNEKEAQLKQEKIQCNKEIQQFLKKQIEEKQQSEMKNKLQFNSEVVKNNETYQQLLKQEMEKDQNALQQGKTIHHFPKTTANWWTF